MRITKTVGKKERKYIEVVGPEVVPHEADNANEQIRLH